MIQVISSNITTHGRVMPLSEFVNYHIPTTYKATALFSAGICIEATNGFIWIIRAETSSPYSCKRLQQFFVNRSAKAPKGWDCVEAD